MAGYDNIKDKGFDTRTTEELRDITIKGGVNSGKARKEKKLLTSALIELLKKGDTINNINTALLEKAMSGDTKAFEVVRDTIGEKPIDKKEVTTPDEDISKDRAKEVLDKLK